ncbi:MAG: DUF2341 domain-containing protein [Gammaproteobacteria bacterium]|nr:DUF2341 domain-containing protein [Gammaproteobacteria bacterium]
MRLKIVLSVFVLFSLVFLVPSDAFGAWYDTSWEYRNKITVSLNPVISSDLSNFPVLVSLTDSDFTQTNNADGTDIVFTESDGTTQLSHEIEKFDSSTGELVAWVKFPTIPSTSTADIYIYYKGNSIFVDSEDVWDSNYNAVFHLNQTATGDVDEFVDVTGNENHGTTGGTGRITHAESRETTQVSGQIGYGQQFAGSTVHNTKKTQGGGDYIWVDEVGSWPTGDLTMELWVGDVEDSPGTGVNYNDIISYCVENSNANGKWSNHLNLWQAKKVKMKVRTDFFVSSATSVEGNNPDSFTNWNHIMAVYNLAENGSGASKLYVNGDLIVSSFRSADKTYSIVGSGSLVIGGDIDSSSNAQTLCKRVNNGFDGKMDEVRISNIQRSADWAAASYHNQGDPSTYLSLGGQETQIEETKKSSDCYDCEAPKLTKVEVHVTSNNYDTIMDNSAPQVSETKDYVWTFDQDTPLPMFGDDITPIVADPGDEVEIILELTDNRTLKRIADSATYTNFLTKPNDMNLFYANNFDEYGKVSTTFYEWHQTGDDLFYDYDNTVEWSKVDVEIEESGELDNRVCCNLDQLAGTFNISFKMKFLQPMQTSDVWVQATDRSGNFFKVALPLTLKVTGNEQLVFESRLNQKVLSFYDNDMLSNVISKWDGSSQNVAELGTILGIPDEDLPPWVANLAVWVSEDRITVADMIVAIEHVLNN